MIREHRPDVIVDSIKIATAIGYQDVYTAAVVAKQVMQNLFDRIEGLTRTVESLTPTSLASPRLRFEIPIPRDLTVS